MVDIQYDKGLKTSAKMNKMKINREISKYNKRNETVEEKKKNIANGMTITVKKNLHVQLRLYFFATINTNTETSKSLDRTVHGKYVFILSSIESERKKIKK